MINKLAFSKKVVLQPLLSNLKSINQNDTLFQINKLDMALEENFNKRQKLMELYAKEYLESAIYTAQNTELLAEAQKLNEDKEKLYASVNEECGYLDALNKLIKYINSIERLKEFDADAFEEHVDHIIVFRRYEIGLALKCGLLLRERL
jgi:site-specific DNA recombinase